MPDKITINIDQSSLSASTCVLHWKRLVVDGYREKVEGAAMIYGKAVHKYIETMFRTKGDIKVSRDAMYKSFRKPKDIPNGQAYLGDENHVWTVAYDLWDSKVSKDTTFQTLLMPNDEPAVEVTFSIPYMETDKYIVRLCGTIDRVGKIHNGCYCIRDWKTTSKWNKKDYLDSYRMSKQLRFYRLALKLMATKEPDSVLGQIGNTNVGACIDAIFLKERAIDYSVESSNVFQFGDQSIVEFEMVLIRKIKRLLEALDANDFPREGLVNGVCEAEAKYACKFINVCGAPEQVRDVMLARDFITKKYDPLTFGE